MTRIVAWAIFLAAASARADEPITLKLKSAGEGDSTVIVKNQSVKSDVKITDGDGKVLHEGKETVAESVEFTETILKRDGAKPATKLERAYRKHSSKKGDGDADTALEGKTVVCEKKDGKYSCTFKDGGKPVGGAAGEALAREMRRLDASKDDANQLMLPKKAVKVGDDWKLDVEPILQEIFRAEGGEFAFDLPKAAGTGKLVKAYKKDGRLFGELRVDISVPIKSIGKGDKKMQFDKPGKLVLEMQLDACIDGSSDAAAVVGKLVISGVGSLSHIPGSVVTVSVETLTKGSQAEPDKK